MLHHFDCAVFCQLAGKVRPREIQPGCGVAMVSGMLVANDNQYTLQVIVCCCV